MALCLFDKMCSDIMHYTVDVFIKHVLFFVYISSNVFCAYISINVLLFYLRACFKKLPHILCFNTMRYTFNMVTMLKEKVNTHFSFPLRLDMSGYVEKHLMPQHYQGMCIVFICTSTTQSFKLKPPLHLL
jgi:hypothetical protein